MFVTLYVKCVTFRLAQSVVLAGCRTPQLIQTPISVLDGSTHVCKSERCGGGVGRNMAEALWRMRNGRVRLLTAVGNDDDGLYLQNIAPGLILDDCVMKDARTATYAAVFDGRGECVLGLGDMNIHNCITIDLVDKHMNKLRDAPLVVLDGNVPSPTVDYVLRLCNQYNKPGK